MLKAIVPNKAARVDAAYISVKGIAHRIIESGNEHKHEGSFVFIHGLFSASEAFEDLMKSLGQIAHCIAINLPGHGKTANEHVSPDTFTPEAISLFITDILQELKLRKVTLVGHSIGGLFAGYTSLKYPKLIERLVLINSTGFFSDVPEILLALRKNPQMIHSDEVLPNLKASLDMYDSAAPSLKAYLDNVIVRRSSQYLLENVIDSNDKS